MAKILIDQVSLIKRSRSAILSSMIALAEAGRLLRMVSDAPDDEVYRPNGLSNSPARNAAQAVGGLTQLEMKRSLL